MARPGALHAALELVERPLLAKAMRRQPLPADVLTLLKIAAGDRPTMRAAIVASGRPPAAIREAAVLYIQNVLLAADANSYRVLGAATGAPHNQLREHLRWLMKWLHPDRCASAWESAFATRVLSAWQHLKSPDRRARYDRSLALRPAGKREGRRGVPWIAGPQQPAPSPPLTTRGRTIAVALALAGALVVLLSPNPRGAEGPPTKKVAASAGRLTE